MFSMSVRIRQCRYLAHLSQADLASKVGVRRSAVAQWEQTEGTSPSVAHMALLATSTGVSFEWLATGRGSMHPINADLDPSMIVGDFARDEIENRALDLIRRLPTRHRIMACRILASMSA
jgi:transcriptional regulator with XRE-family HTH domain